MIASSFAFAFFRRLFNAKPRCWWGLGLFVLTVQAMSILAQPTFTQRMPAAAMNFRHYTVEHGLSQNTVYVSLQDREGFLWFGTGDGLNRFDGSSFLTFRSKNTDSTLSSNFIRALQQDRFGMIWIGTKGGGLNALNPTTRKFTVFKHSASNTRSLSDNQVSALLVSRDARTLWVGTESNGVAMFDVQAFASNPANRTFTTLSLPAAVHKAHAVVSCLYEDSSGGLWVGTQGGALRYNQRNGSFRVFSRATGELPSDSVQAITQDAHGRIWFATYNGLARYDECLSEVQAWKWYHSSQYSSQNNLTSLHNDETRVLYADAQKRLWIGTSQGLSQYIDETDSFVQHSRDVLNPRSLGGDLVFSIMQDKSGVLWVSTYGTGLNAYHDNMSAFTTYTYSMQSALLRSVAKEYAAHSLPADGISALCEDARGMVWIGTWTSGIVKFNRRAADNTNSEAVFTRFQAATSNATSASRKSATKTAQTSQILPPTALSSDIIRGICEDRAGFLWITTLHGVDKFDPRTERVVARHKHDPNNPNSLSSDNTFAAFEDSRGLLWVSTLGQGLNSFNPKTGVWTRYLHNPDNANSLSHNIVRSVAEDKQGFIWITTKGGGLNRFDAATGTFKHFRHDDTNPQSISSDALFGLYFDGEGVLWIGTQGGGLCRFDGASETFHTFREADGLPNDVVYGIMEDDERNLWFSTNKGLGCLNRSVLHQTLQQQALRTKSASTTVASSGLSVSSPKPAYLRLFERNPLFRRYDVHDGLQSDEFNAGAYCKGRSGRLYFGGVLGFNECVPHGVRENMVVPPVAITAFKLFNREQPVRTTYDGGAMPVIKLTHRDNFFSFEFSSLNYVIPEKNRYAYKLEGFDEDWVDAGGKREAMYTNLPEGEYTFYVRATNNNGVWNMNGAGVRLHILPPWWRTWWFRVGAVLLGLTALIVAYKARTRALTRIAKRLEQEVSRRTAELNERNEELSGANEEIQRQLTMLDEQTRMIELSNAALQEKNLEIEYARFKSDELLLNVLPAPIAERLKAGEQSIADCYDNVTVLFADIAGFTSLATRQSAGEVVQLLNRIFSAFDIFSERYGLEKIKTIGDAYMIVGGAPSASNDPKQDAASVANMALEMLTAIEVLDKTVIAKMMGAAMSTTTGTTTNAAAEPLSIRIGIHTGTVVAGVIGQKKFAYDLWGDTVNTASRMESHGVPGKIHVTEEVYSLLHDSFVFEKREQIEVKGKGMMQTYFLLEHKEPVRNNQ